MNKQPLSITPSEKQPWVPPTLTILPLQETQGGQTGGNETDGIWES